MTRFIPLAGMMNTKPDHLFLPTQVKDDQVHTVGWYGEYHAWPPVPTYPGQRWPGSYHGWPPVSTYPCQRWPGSSRWLVWCIPCLTTCSYLLRSKMTRFIPLAGMMNTMPDHLFLPTQVKDDQVHPVGWYGEYHAWPSVHTYPGQRWPGSSRWLVWCTGACSPGPGCLNYILAFRNILFKYNQMIIK